MSIKTDYGIFDRFIHRSILILLLSTAAAHGAQYTLVINNGRVMDPETGLDAIRHLGLVDDRIVEISDTPLSGTQEIDASGLVVAPGFIDLHTHSPTRLGQHYQLFDGITTALELEVGAFPVADYAGQISEQPLINFGSSAAYLNMRMLHKNGIAVADATATPWPEGTLGWFTVWEMIIGDFQSALAPTFNETANSEELIALRKLLESGLDGGALGIGLPLDYFSEAVEAAELEMIFSVAAQRGAPIFVHIRRGINGDPSGLREVIDLAESTGASVHVCHISHNAMRNIELFLQQIRSAQLRGIDITTEVLPYDAGSTAISAAVFGRDWRTIFNIDYEDVEWAATGERLTQATFNDYRENQPGGAVIHHYLDEAWTRRAIEEPGVIIVSDLITMNSRDEHVPPHNGAFTKVLGRYVREKGAINLMTAIEKMTLLPARRLQDYSPGFARKGRIQEGMDADITVFDPQRIEDQATYRDPYREALGLEAIIVNGTPVVLDGLLLDGVYPGRRLLRAN